MADRRVSWLEPDYRVSVDDNNPSLFVVAATFSAGGAQGSILIQTIPEYITNGTITRIVGGTVGYGNSFRQINNESSQTSATYDAALTGAVLGGLIVMPPNTDVPADLPDLEDSYNQPWLWRFNKAIHATGWGIDNMDPSDVTPRQYYTNYAHWYEVDADVRAQRKVRKGDQLFLVLEHHFQGETGSSFNLNVWTDLRVLIKE